MGLLKTALIGAAVYGAVKYLTKKDNLGKTKLDSLQEQMPEWLERARTRVNEFKAENIPRM